MRIRFAVVLLSLVLVAAVARADKTARKIDLFWTSPELASLDLRSIAMLPTATYDDNAEARRLTEAAVGQALRGAGYRWTSTLVTRDQMLHGGGDSLLKALNTQLGASPRLDSLQAPFYSRLTHSRVLLTARVDLWERHELEFNQAGNPATNVGLHLALVDSTGRLLWTATGLENDLGPYQDPSTTPVGIQASGLNNKPLTNQGGAPRYQDTLAKLVARLAEQFPARPAPAAPPEK